MRIEKLREEMEKAWQRAAQWQARARDLEKQVTEQENLQIIQAVRGISASPEELGEVLRRIRAMKGLGASVFAEVTPQHFSLTERAVVERGTLAKVNPPLREEADRYALIRGLKDGTIDFIATDHAPHSREEKEWDLNQAPSGMIGLETALALGITNLVRKGHLTLLQLLEKMTVNPARFYGLDCGTLKEGAAADLVIFDEREAWTVEEDKFHSKSCNSPFIGMELYGKVCCTICGGQVVYEG